VGVGAANRRMVLERHRLERQCARLGEALLAAER
jgi:hypothetical protein